MAAPQVSAAAAMILSLGYQPYSALKSMILGGVDLEPSLAGKVSTGGRLNLCKALPGCTGAVAATPAIAAAPLITGVPGYGSTLSCRSFATTSAAPSAATSSRLSRAITAGGVLAGAASAFHDDTT